MNPKIDPSLIGIGKSQTHVFGGAERDVLEEQIQKLWKNYRSTLISGGTVYETELITATQGFVGNLPTTLQIRTSPWSLHHTYHNLTDITEFLISEANVLESFIQHYIGIKVRVALHSQVETDQHGNRYSAKMLISDALPYDEVLRFVTEDLVRGKNLGII